MTFWFDETIDDICRFGVKADKTLFSKQSDFQLVEVIETPGFGRVLAIDKIFMTSERDEYLYHEMLVHPVMTVAPKIKRILVIGGGDGGTVREVLSYAGVEEVVMVEIDPVVVEASKAFLNRIGTAWDDERLTVIFGDGLRYVADESLTPFDVILLDHSDPVGPAEGLFDAGFYRNCMRRLCEKGVFCLQSESPLMQRKTFVNIVQTLRGIFECVYPYFGTVPLYATGAWSWTMASRHVDPLAVDPEKTSFQESRCRYYNRDIHNAAFAVSNELRPLLAKR